MKLYTSVGPNPRIVRMFAAEKQIPLTEHWIDLAGGENRRPHFLSINPSGQLPVLEVAPDHVIAETVAICEYLDETHPGKKLLGSSAEVRAQVRMWIRRVEHNYCHPLTSAFRYGPALALFRNRVHCIPHAAEDMAKIAREGSVWINQQLGVRSYLAGETFSLADIVLYCFVDFARQRAGQPLDPELRHLIEWFERIEKRPSASLTAADTYTAMPAK